SRAAEPADRREHAVRCRPLAGRSPAAGAGRGGRAGGPPFPGGGTPGGGGGDPRGGKRPGGAGREDRVPGGGGGEGGGAREAPDKGVLRLLRELRSALGPRRHLAVLLAQIGPEGVRPSRAAEVRIWEQSLASLEDPYLAVEPLRGTA